MSNVLKNKKYLLCAFACDPFTGSEPYVGASWTKILKPNFELYVLTRKANRSLVRGSELEEGVKFLYFDMPFCENISHYHKFIKGYYILWHIFLLFPLLFWHIKYRFEFVHQLTYNVVDMPSFLWLLPRTKFVWGPVGGGQVPPDSLRKVYGDSWHRQKTRASIKKIVTKLPHVRFAKWRASLIMTANIETQKLLNVPASKAALVLETALDSKGVVKQRDDKFVDPVVGLSLLWVGRLESRKALEIALDCVKNLALAYPGWNIKLTVVGNGPKTSAYKEKVARDSLAAYVDFVGAVTFDEVARYYDLADIFLFTSVQDTSGNVMLEAMASGLPVVALNHQGAAIILKEGAGVLVDLGGYHEVVNGFVSGVTAIATNRTLRAALTEKSLAAARGRLSWEAKEREYLALLLDRVPHA